MNNLFYDIEIYPNYFLVVIEDERGVKHRFDSTNKELYLKQLNYIDSVKHDRLFIGYNNVHYDSIILEIMLRNKHKETWQLAADLYKATKLIIEDEKWPPSVLARLCGRDAKVSTFQLDLMMLSPNRLSLKEFGIRIHHEKLETLPIAPGTTVSDAQILILRDYCDNDVTITRKLHDGIFAGAVATKHSLIKSFNLPGSFYSQSDRKITEHIICDFSVKPKPKRFKYKCPIDLNFKNPELQNLLETYENIDFDSTTKFSKTITINGELEITFALGGLHAVIKNYQGSNLIDIDGRSYYPYTIKHHGYLPDSVANKQAYYDMIDDRIEDKLAGLIELSDAKKIVINTVFGAMNYKNSQLLDLKNLYYTTITGQLMLAKLIEDLSDAGYRVVYGNTDGIIIEETNELSGYKTICDNWEKLTQHVLEYQFIKKAIIRDVNNYIIVKRDDEKLKLKGDYDWSNPAKKLSAYARISTRAVIEHVLYGKSIEEVIMESNDIRDFVLYHKYGAQYFPCYVKDDITNKTTNFEKVIRFYLSNRNKNHISAYNNNTQGWIRKDNTQNIQPLFEMDITKIYNDLDKDRYIEIAYDVLEALTGKDVIFNAKVDGYVDKLKNML